MVKNIIKSFLFSSSLILLGLFLTNTISRLDSLFGIINFQSMTSTAFGMLFLVGGFILRFWATFLFYESGINVVALHAQKALITSGPYRFSRNPLYLGLICIGLGSGLLAGSLLTILFTIVGFIFADYWIRYEEKHLEQIFGEEYRKYKNNVPRWLPTISLRKTS